MNSTENRLGVTANVLTPMEALEVVRRAVKPSPDIRVVGVAWLGDTLATPCALETFRLIAAHFQELLLTCAETDDAKFDAEPYIRVFRHCQYCWADAIGVPGGVDFSWEIYGERARGADTYSHG